MNVTWKEVSRHAASGIIKAKKANASPFAFCSSAP